MWGVYSLRSRSYMEMVVAWLGIEMATTIRMQHHVRSNGDIGERTNFHRPGDNKDEFRPEFYTLCAKLLSRRCLNCLPGGKGIPMSSRNDRNRRGG